MTRGTDTMGTAHYMSPEQIEHAGEIDGRADVFSLAAVLFEMLGGYRPFSGDSEHELMQRIVAGERRYLPDQAGPLGEVIDRAMATDREGRYPSAAAFADAVRPFASLEVRERVASWSGTGRIENPDALASARILLQTPEPELPAAPATISARDARRSEVTRNLGMLQLASGVFNLTVMSAVQCFGIGLLGGLPACLAGWLVIVGLAEIGSGIAALAFGSTRWMRLTAWLELASILGLGVLSTIVGLVVLVVQQRARLEAESAP